MKTSTLKKEFSTKDVNRLRNIVNKNYDGGTVTQAGYKKSYQQHVEGDVWEENGKSWTIKNGIKQNITKMDVFKQQTLIPILCPKCSKPLKHHLDKKFYVLQKQCLDCVAKFETQLRMDGKWEEYEQNIIKNNAKAYVNDIEQAFEEYLNTNESFVTEAGDVENWNGNINKEQLKNEFRIYIEALKNNMKL